MDRLVNFLKLLLLIILLNNLFCYTSFSFNGNEKHFYVFLYYVLIISCNLYIDFINT